MGYVMTACWEQTGESVCYALDAVISPTAHHDIIYKMRSRLFSVLPHVLYLIGYIVMGSWKGRGNHYILGVKALYYNLLTSDRQLSAAYPHEVRSKFES